MKKQFNVYLWLFCGSIFLTLISLCFNGKTFNILSNIGGGAVASIITAYIISLHDKKEYNKNNLLQINTLLQQWDAIVRMNLQVFLDKLFDDSIIAEGIYQIDDIVKIIENLNDEKVLSSLYERLNDTIFNINIGILISDKPSPTNNELYQYLKNIMDNFNSFLYIKDRYVVNENIEFLKELLKFELESICHMNSLRNNKIHFEVPNNK